MDKQIVTFTAVDGTTKVRGEIAIEDESNLIDIVVDGDAVFRFRQRGTAGNWFLVSVRRISDGVLQTLAGTDVPYLLERHQ